MIEALVGAAVGVVTIVVARAIRAERWLYSLGLVVLPGLYAFFALRVGQREVAIQEMVYGAPWLVAGLLFTFASWRYSSAVVGALWLLHGVWDLVNSRFIANPGVPDWYPVWCCAVDVVVGAYLLRLSRRGPVGDLRRA